MVIPNVMDLFGTKKHKNLKTKISEMEDKKEELLNLKNTNNTLSKRIIEIEKIVNAPTTIKEFDKETFNSIIDKIIIGEKNVDGNNSNVVRFILKTGAEYKCENNGINTSVSFGTYKRFS